MCRERRDLAGLSRSWRVTRCSLGGSISASESGLGARIASRVGKKLTWLLDLTHLM